MCDETATLIFVMLIVAAIAVGVWLVGDALDDDGAIEAAEVEDAE